MWPQHRIYNIYSDKSVVWQSAYARNGEGRRSPVSPARFTIV